MGNDKSSFPRKRESIIFKCFFWILAFARMTLALILGDPKRKSHSLTKQKEEPVFEEMENPNEIKSEKPQKDISTKELIIMRLIASPNHLYAGYELLQTLLSVGFRFGKMDIFHRHEQVNGEGSILFSLAQAAEPGTFKIHNMGSCSCKGLTMFMHIADHKDPMSTFETMLNTAKQLVDDLGGEIWDERNLPLDHSVIERWRAKIRNYLDSLYSYDLFDEAQPDDS